MRKAKRPPCLCTGRNGIRCDASHCDLAHPTGAPGDADQCVLCWQWLHSEPHNRLWGGNGKVKPYRPQARCRHLGVATGEMKDCTNCTNSPRLKLFACGVHGSCTLGKRVEGTACCLDCPDYAPAPPPRDMATIRHLLYFVYPHKANGGRVWRWNIAKLKRRMSLFNGRRIIGIAVDGSTDSAEAVKTALAGCGCEFIETPNDPKLKEVALFPDLLARLSDCTGPEHAFFYGHAKGVDSRRWTAKRGWKYAVRLWTEAMYDACLDHWPLVRRLLQDYPVAGPFLRSGYRFPEAPDPARCTWHYSGSFRWHRCADLFARDWRRVQAYWCGAEMQPGELFRRDEAACILGGFEEVGLCLYTDDFWNRWAIGEVDRFREESRADRWQPLLLTCILTSHRKPGFVHEAIASVQKQSTPDWQLLIMDSGDLDEAGEFSRYANDPRILTTTTGEKYNSSCPATQSWAINECFRRGLVRGDLAVYLSDDDVFEPHAFETYLDRARTHPDEHAWYGLAERCEVRRDGREVKLGHLPLPPVKPGTVAGKGGVSLDMKADGGQLCHRVATAYAPWPESRQRAIASHSDGLWIDAVGRLVSIHPLLTKVLRHRHTALSTFSRSSDAARRVDA